jgi:hypothetical protein
VLIQDLGMEMGHRRLQVDLTRDETDFAARLLAHSFSGKPLEDLLLVDAEGIRWSVLHAEVKDLELDMDEGWAFELTGEMLPLKRLEPL